MNKLLWIWLSLFPVSLVAQEIRPLAYWQFESKDSWREDDRKQHKMGGLSYAKVTREGGQVGNYLQIPQNELNQMDVKMDVRKAVTIEYWFRMPEFAYNQENMMFHFSDRRIYTSFEYPQFRFRTWVKQASGKKAFDDFSIGLDGVGRNSYNYYVDNKWHHLVFKYDPATGRKELWVDGELPEGFSKTIAEKGTFCGSSPCANERLYFGMPTSYKSGFAGDIDEVAIYDRFVPEALHKEHYEASFKGKPYSFTLPLKSASPKTRALPTASPKIDIREFVPGHPNVSMSPIDQLRQFPRPRYQPGHQLIRIFNWMELPYLGGVKAPGVSYEQAVQNSVMLQEELALNWHYIIGLQNTKIAGNERERTSSDRFLGAWIQLANRYPEIPVSATTFWPQTNPKVVGDGQTLPNIYRQKLPDTYYFRDGKGNFLQGNGTPGATTKILSLATHGDAFKVDGRAQRFYLEKILSELSRPLNFINENGEVIPYPIPGHIAEKDPAMVRHKNALGISDWESYQARQKTRFRALYSNEFLTTLPGLKQTIFTWYAVDGGPHYLNRFKWEEARKINTKINGQYYSTPDLYPRWPFNWRMNRGAWHGWEWIRMTRGIEIMAGDKLFSPFVAAGWNKKPEINMRPSQWLGMLKAVGVVGAEFYYTGFFNEGGGGTEFPNPANYIWQAALPSYAQAITSRYEEVLRNGSLLKDEKGQPIINNWAGNESILTVVRKHDKKDLYIISGSIQPTTNLPGNVPDEALAIVDLGDFMLRFSVRRQGSTYLFDRTDPANPIFYQLDTWHETGHPLYWSKSFAFEAEVYDQANQAQIVTSRPKEHEADDFTAFDTYVKAGSTPARLGYRFTPIPGQHARLKLELRLRNSSTSGKEAKVQVYLDGKAIGKPICIKDQEWEWFTAKPYTFSHLSPQEHLLELELLHEEIQVDRLLLRAK